MDSRIDEGPVVGPGRAGTRGRSVTAIACKTAVTAFLLWYVLRIIPLPEVLEALSATVIGPLVVALLLQLLVRCASAWRLRDILHLHGIGLPVRAILEVILVTNFYGLLLPGIVTGGAVMWYRVRRAAEQPASGMAVLSAIAFNRLAEFVVLLGAGIALWVVDVGAAAGLALGLQLALVFAGLSAIYLLLTTGIAAGLVGQIARRVRVLSTAVEALNRLPRWSPRAHGRIAAVSVVQVILGAAAFYLFAAALSLPISLITATWLRSLVVVLQTLPISIAGLGVREGTLVLLLGPYGVEPADAVAFSLLLFSGTLFVGALGALLEVRAALFRTGRRLGTQ